MLKFLIKFNQFRCFHYYRLKAIAENITKQDKKEYYLYECVRCQKQYFDIVEKVSDGNE